MTAHSSDPLDHLTPREREIARGVADGLTNREIASLCRLSERTVRNRLSLIFEKLGVSRRTQLVRLVLAKRRD